MSYQHPSSGWRGRRRQSAEPADPASRPAQPPASAEQLGAVLEGTLDGVFSIGRDWRFVYANSQALKELSATPDIIGRKVLDVFPRMPEAPFWSAYRRVMAERVEEFVEAYSHSLEGWYEAHVVPSDGGIIVFFRNIDGRKAAEAALRQSNARLRTLLDSLPQMIWSCRNDGAEEYFNRQWFEFTGVSRDAADRPQRIDLVHPDDRARAQGAWESCLATGEPYECEYRLRHHSGEHFWIISRSTPQRDEAGNVLWWYGSCTEIHQSVLAREALRRTEAFTRSIIEASADSIGLVDAAGTILFANSVAMGKLQEKDGGTLIGRSWPETFPESMRGDARAALAAATRCGYGHLTAKRTERDGNRKWWDIVVTAVPDADGKPERFAVISRDITDQKMVEERVRWSATHDALTGLSNRALFQDRLETAIEAAGRTRRSLGLLLLDLNDFKLINDTLGHDAGDTLLCAFAERLRSSIRGEDFVARLGGDEFAVILADTATRDALERAADQVLHRLREPYLCQGGVLDCHASIGASLYPASAKTGTELLKQADVALYASKSAGQGRMMVFEPHMRADMQQRRSMLSLAREALDKDLVVAHYQPKVNLESGRVIGLEALLRLRMGGKGVQGPSAIKAAFEDLELAASISDRMIDRAIADMRAWLDRGVDFGHVAINAAAAEFRRGQFAEALLERLHRAEVPTRCIQVEVTETVFLGRGAEYVEQALRRLSRAGVQIALDDFGTGYASLAHLKQFPVDVLKIDRSFIRDLKDDASGPAIIRAVINLGHSLDIQVVAEGVENEAQHAFLHAQGCDFGQGYLYGRAVPPSLVPAVLDLPLEARFAAA